MVAKYDVDEKVSVTAKVIEINATDEGIIYKIKANTMNGAILMNIEEDDLKPYTPSNVNTNSGNTDNSSNNQSNQSQNSSNTNVVEEPLNNNTQNTNEQNNTEEPNNNENPDQNEPNTGD